MDYKTLDTKELVFIDRSEDFENKVALENDASDDENYDFKVKTPNIDSEFLDNKLCGYTCIHYQQLSVNDHARVTKNLYQKDGRKCVYIIVKEILGDGCMMVGGYKSTYPNWKINPNCKFKQHRFYKKI